MAKRYFCVSDVHGYYDILQQALKDKGFDINNDEHILIIDGDAFDRGTQAELLFDFIKTLHDKDRLIYIRGNHEDLLIECVDQLKKTGGCAGPIHWSNGTMYTVLELNDCGKLKELLKFIVNECINYFQLGDYIFTHGWVPAFAYDDNLNDYSSDMWKQARWTNGIAEAMESRHIIEGKTVVCGHWHTVEANKKYHNKGSGNFDEDGDFGVFKAKGIIAIDAATAFSKKINVIEFDDNGNILE